MKGCFHRKGDLMDKYHVRDTTLSFNNNDTEVNHQNRWDGSLPHYKLFLDVMRELSQNGFFVEKDKSINETIRKDYYYGRYNSLEFKARRYPAGFEITFYQNINHVNKCGGYCDFDKFDKMPYLQKLIFKNTTNKIGKYLEERSISCDSDPVLKTSEEKVKYRFVESWHHDQKDMNFKLSDLNGTTCDQSYNNTDRDKKTIYNGDIKYFRSWNGYLMRGRVYHNINNMWWVILNKHEYTNIADFDLFDLTESDKRGRLAKHRPPKEYIERKEKILESSTTELVNELRRRGLKVG